MKYKCRAPELEVFDNMTGEQIFEEVEVEAPSWEEAARKFVVDYLWEDITDGAIIIIAVDTENHGTRFEVRVIQSLVLSELTDW